MNTKGNSIYTDGGLLASYFFLIMAYYVLIHKILLQVFVIL